MQLSLLHKFHDNTCSLIRFTLYGYLRIMYFRNMFYYGKSKAGSVCFAGPAFVYDMVSPTKEHQNILMQIALQLSSAVEAHPACRREGILDR